MEQDLRLLRRQAHATARGAVAEIGDMLAGGVQRDADLGGPCSVAFRNIAHAIGAPCQVCEWCIVSNRLGSSSKMPAGVLVKYFSCRSRPVETGMFFS